MLKILIIDDNEIFRNTLTEDLREFKDTEVYIAPDSSDEIIDLLKSASPPYTDIIIDYGLKQGMNADSFIERLENVEGFSLPNCWLVSGAISLPEEIKSKFRSVFIKPVRSQEIHNQLLSASSQAQEIEIPDAIKKLPFPLRVVNPLGAVIYKNELWTWDATNPSPDKEKYREILTPEKRGMKTWLMRSVFVNDSLRLDICESIEKNSVGICASKQLYFDSLRKIGLSRGRFYEVIPIPNIKGQPEFKLRLCAASHKINENEGETYNYNDSPSHIYEYPLDGCLLERIKKHKKGIPDIVSFEDDENDEGIKYWNQAVDAQKVRSRLEIPLFNQNSDSSMPCGLMIFDRLESNRIEDDDDKDIVSQTTVKFHMPLLQRIIEDAEAKMEKYGDELHFNLMKQLETFDEVLQKTNDSKELLQGMLDLSIKLCNFKFAKVDAGLILMPSLATGTIEVVAASGSLKDLTKDIISIKDRRVPLYRSFTQRTPVYIQDISRRRYARFDYKKLFPGHIDGAMKAEKLKNRYEKELKAAISLPIQAGDDFFGILHLQSSHKPYCFEKPYIDIVNTLIQRTVGYLALKKVHESQKNWQLAIAHEIRSDTAPILHSLDRFGEQRFSDIRLRRIERHTVNIKDLAENLFTIESNLKSYNESFFEEFFADIKSLCALMTDDPAVDERIIDFPLLDAVSHDIWAIRLQGVKGEFLRVIRVLLDNAVRHASAPEISVDLIEEGAFIVLTLINSGFIEKEDLEHIFDPFYRSSSSKSRIRLGLAAAKKIADGIGGSLDIASDKTEQKVIAVLKWPIMKV